MAFLSFHYTNDIKGCNMTQEDIKRYITQMYPERLFITKNEVCKLLNISLPTLDRRMKKDPNFSKIVRKDKKRVYFSIPELARILADEEVS